MQPLSPTTASTRANAYRPSLRSGTVRVLTQAGWLSGAIMLPQLQALTEHLTKCGPIVKLTQVQLPGREEPVPFFALRTSAAALVVTIGDARPVSEPPSGALAEVIVTLLLEHGVLEGRIMMPATVRLSDYLRQQQGFLGVRDATWLPNVPTRPGQGAPLTFPYALVNASIVIGVEETERRPAAG